MSSLPRHEGTPDLGNLAAVVPAHRLQQFGQRLGEVLLAHIPGWTRGGGRGGDQGNTCSHNILTYAALKIIIEKVVLGKSM